MLFAGRCKIFLEDAAARAAEVGEPQKNGGGGGAKLAGRGGASRSPPEPRSALRETVQLGNAVRVFVNLDVTARAPFLSFIRKAQGRQLISMV